jgi:hypothetical protein
MKDILLNTIMLISVLGVTPVVFGEEAQENNTPVASSDDYLLQPGTSEQINLQATDPDEDTLSFIITALPAAGTVQADSVELTSDLLPYTLAGGGNTVTYVTGADDSGTYTLKFKADDGTDQSSETTINITVNSPPEAEQETFFTQPNEDLDFELPVADDGVGTLAFTIMSLPGHGRIKFGQEALTDSDIPYQTDQSDLLYSPDEDYHGDDEFELIASDGFSDSPTISVSIEVNTTPVPETLDVTVPPNDQTTITLQSVDADLDPVEYILASLPAHGQLSVLGTVVSEGDLPLVLDGDINEVNYAVDTDYCGTDSFHYRVQDDVSVSGRAIVKISVNTSPSAEDQEVSVSPEAATEIVLTPCDADGDTLSISITQLPEFGQLSINERSVTSTDNSYQVSDEGLTVTYTPETAEETETDEEGAEGPSSDTESSSSDEEKSEEETEEEAVEAVDQWDSFTWVVDDGKESSPSAVVNIHITNGDDNSDNDFVGEESETVVCGALSAESVLLACLMFIAPGRRIFHFSSLKNH